MDGYPNLGLGLEPPAARLRRPIWLPIAVIGFLQKKIAVIGPSTSKARENFQKKTSTFPKSNHGPGSSLCYSRHAFFLACRSVLFKIFQLLDAVGDDGWSGTRGQLSRNG